MDNRANTTPCTSIEANKCVSRKAFFIILFFELKELMELFFYVSATLSSNQKFKCPVIGCSAKCKSLENLNIHMEKKHPPCVVCNKRSKNEKAKMEHELQHTPKCTHSIVNDGECTYCKVPIGFLPKDVVSSTRFM